jgi:tetratricopeptide (TPR) repeat protein
MQGPVKDAVLVVVLTALCLACPIAWAEKGILVVRVEDVQRRPVAGLEIGVEGAGGLAVTDANGRARIRLAPESKEKSWVSLQIVKSPVGQDLVMVSPWDYRAQVPSFENKSDNFVEVVVVRRGERATLESGSVFAALTAKINKANAPKSADKQAVPENPKANLEATAKQFGLSPEDLDKAIKAWGAQTIDPYDAGMAALYERNYSKATVDLQDSLKQREEAVADAASSLGASLYQQGRYGESARAYQRSLQIRPDDPSVLNSAAVSLMRAGDYAGAEPVCRRALAIREKTLSSDDPDVATSLNTLAELLREKGEYQAAEPLMRRALAIDERRLVSDDPHVARDMNNLAELLRARGDYAAAEPLYRRALAIDEKALGSDNPDVARDLSSLAALLYAQGDYAGAQPLYRRALAIREKVFGPDHPLIAQSLNNLAALLEVKGDYGAAEPLLPARSGD